MIQTAKMDKVLIVKKPSNRDVADFYPSNTVRAGDVVTLANNADNDYKQVIASMSSQTIVNPTEQACRCPRSRQW